MGNLHISTTDLLNITAADLQPGDIKVGTEDVLVRTVETHEPDEYFPNGSVRFTGNIRRGAGWTKKTYSWTVHTDQALYIARTVA